jgi:hypothetical protein
VDGLLESPRYGERWGRYWLDLARYSDDRLESEVDAPYANAFRYRDWVIKAFNRDMPFDKFVKAQIAGDQLGEEYAAGLGFYGLRPDTQDDRVDATGRVFLGLTTGCAQCHNHKFDPIPTTDYYALQVFFESTENTEIPLAPEPVVKEYKAREKAYNDKKAQIQTSYTHRRSSWPRCWRSKPHATLPRCAPTRRSQPGRRNARALAEVSGARRVAASFLEGLVECEVRRREIPGRCAGGVEGAQDRRRGERHPAR